MKEDATKPLRARLRGEYRSLYTVHQLAYELVPYHCRVLIAHAHSLGDLGLITRAEEQLAVGALQGLIIRHGESSHSVTTQAEDSETIVRRALVESLGPQAQKVYTACSPSDVAVTAFRLFECEELVALRSELYHWIETLRSLRGRWGEISLPGYSHMRAAMPTSVGDWLEGYAASAHDNIQQLVAALTLLDQSPLGSGTGFGIPVVDVDRDASARMLGFERVMSSSSYAQLSWGKFEAVVVHLVGLILLDCNRMASDLLFMSQEQLGLVRLPQTAMAQSVLMPNVEAPRTLEMLRSQYQQVLGEEVKIKSLLGNLVFSGHEELIPIQASVMQALNQGYETLSLLRVMLEGIEIDAGACSKTITPKMRQTERLHELIREGYTVNDARDMLDSDG